MTDRIDTAREALDLLGIGVGVFDPELRLRFCNTAFRELRRYPEALCQPGVPLEVLLAFNAERGDFGPGDPARQAADRLAEIKSASSRDAEMKMAGGQVLHAGYRRTADGGLVVTYDDRTDERQAETALGRSEARVQSLLSTIGEGILLVDAEDRVELWNDRYREIFSQALGGADITEMIYRGRPFFDMIREGYERGMFKPHPDGVDGWMEGRRKSWATPAAQRELELASGQWILLNEHAMPEGGRVAAYTDITEFKRREAEAQAARQRFAEAIEAISSGFALFDSEDRLVIWNSRFERYFERMSDVFVPGATFREMLTASIERGLFPASEGDDKGFLDRLLAQRAQGIGKVRENRLADGLWLQIRDHRTKDGGIVSIYTDVTELKEKQIEIEAQSEILELTLENMGQGITLVDKNLHTVALNRKFLELMQLPEDRFGRGFTMEEAFRYNAQRGEYGPGDVEEQVRERLALSAQFKAHRFERIRPDGRTLEIVGNPIEGGGFVSTYTDITERKKAEEELRNREAELSAALDEFNAILDHIDYGVMFMGKDLRVRVVNRALQRMWDFSDEFMAQKPTMREMIENNLRSGLYDVAEEDRERWVEDRLASVVQGEIPTTEMRRADGKVLTYQCVSLPDGGRMLTYFDITQLKEREVEIIRAKDAAEEALHELQRAQERLVQAEKMASLGQLTAGIAHEIKNPLNFVNNFAKLSDELLAELGELLAGPIASIADEDDREDATDLLETVRGNLRKINEHGRRADSIVKNMLLHAREGPSERQELDVNALVDEALNLAYHGARAEHPGFNIDMKRDLAPDLGRIGGFPQDLMRVFLNIISNGMYAADKRGKAAGEGFNPEIAVVTRAGDSGIEIEIRDNGTGIPREMIDRIFNPFFTTKPAGEGTGLGLSLSYDIVVKQHGGDLTVESEPDAFTVFKVKLPATGEGVS